MSHVEVNEKELKKKLKEIIDRGINLEYEFNRDMIETTWEQDESARRTYKPGQCHFHIWGDLK